MWISALDRKLLREIGRLKGQIATIAVVLAGGIICFIAMRGTVSSLEWSRDAYYDRYRFADVFARAERAPESVARRIEALAGVEVVQTRISEEIALPIEGMERAAYARLLSLPRSGEPATNALHVQSGRLPEYGTEDEVVVLESFGRAHGLRPGDRLPAIVNGKLRQLRVVGLALSPEFVYAIRPGALADDPKRYAVLWMQRSALETAFQLDGCFNDLTLRLQPGASESATLEAVDTILAPYGGSGAVSRKDQPSNRILTGELGQLGSLAGMIPIVFLGVAAFLINMVLGRLISLQRTEIAALKAVGYTNWEVGRHYLGLVAVVMLPGGLLGVGGGLALGHVVLGFYGAIFRFPDLKFRLSTSLIASAILASTFAAVLGALFAVRSAVNLPPAEAMRPPAPARYRRGFLERLGLSSVLGSSAIMVIREVERRPLRTALSALGLAGTVALIILGHFGSDSLNHYLEAMYRREQRQDLTVTFAHPAPPSVVGELARMPGVITAEGVRAVPIRVRLGHRTRDSVLLGFPAAATLRRLLARNGHEVPIPEGAVILSKKLAEVLDIQVGDRPELEVREAERATVRPVVAGFVDDSVGLYIYAQSSLVGDLEGDLGAVSSALLRVDPDKIASVEAHLRRAPNVIDVSDVKLDIQRLRDMNGAAMDIWSAVSVTLAASVIFGVVYNNARIALAMRSRDLASLRVLGFSRGEISSILIGGLALEVLLAIPLGLWLGKQWADFFFKQVDQETFRFQVLISGRTYFLAVVVTLLAAAASSLWVRRSLDRLDLIGVLKTRE
jgi:putative ABC transport system permease protein